MTEQRPMPESRDVERAGEGAKSNTRADLLTAKQGEIAGRPQLFQ